MDSKAGRGDYITLQYIVEQYMLQRGDATLQHFTKYYQMGIKGFKRLNIDILGSLRVCVKDLPSSNAIKFPIDYINYSRIGLVEGKTIRWLGKNEGLLIDRCGNILTEIRNQYPYYGYGNFFGGYYGSGRIGTGNAQYGIGGGNNASGYYNIDVEKGLIAFDSLISGKVILEYVSNGIDSKSEVFVHQFCEEAITNYIHWQSIAFKSNVPAVEKQMAKRDYLEEEQHVLRREHSMNKEEWLQVLRKRNIASPTF